MAAVNLAKQVGTTKGDLYVYNGTTLVRQPVGSDGQVLKAASGQATGVQWAAESGGGGGGGAADPDAVAGLAGWWKADAVTGLSDTDPVTTWPDSSAGSRDLTGSGATRPTWHTNQQNSLPAVRFVAASSTRLQNAAPPTGMAGVTLLAVMKWNATGSGAGLFSAHVASGNDWNNADGFAFTNRVSEQRLVFTRAVGTTTGEEWTERSVNGQWGIYCVRLSKGTMALYSNGAGGKVSGYTDVTTIDPTGLLMGARWTSGAVAGTFGSFDMGEFCLYSRDVGDFDLRAVIEGLRSRWGL